MNEVSYSSISTSGLNRETKLSKQLKNPYSIISSETTYAKPLENETKTKEIVFLTKTVNRLEQDINFMQHEHCQMLEGLQKQIDRLREENQDLQFQLVMRSNRLKEPDTKISQKSKCSDFVSSELISDQILHLKQALSEERRKNKDLLDQLDLLKNSNADSIIENQNNVEKSDLVLNDKNTVCITPEIRLSLNPLLVSMYQHDTGDYAMRTPLTIQDCEMVIQTLLKKIDNSSDLRNTSASTRSLSSSNQQTRFIPGIRKPLQPIKPISRGATSVKPTLMNNYSSSALFGISSNKKLMPVISTRNEMKLEQESSRLNVSRKSERKSKYFDALSSFTDCKTGGSLPALPKSNDYNQAEKQRRLHLLQRKRLDNNRS